MILKLLPGFELREHLITKIVTLANTPLKSSSSTTNQTSKDLHKQRFNCSNRNFKTNYEKEKLNRE